MTIIKHSGSSFLYCSHMQYIHSMSFGVYIFVFVFCPYYRFYLSTTNKTFEAISQCFLNDQESNNLGQIGMARGMLQFVIVSQQTPQMQIIHSYQHLYFWCMNHKSSVYLRCTLLAAPHVNPVHTKRRRFTFSETVLGQLKYNQDGRTVFRLVVRKERYMHMFIRIIHYSRAVQMYHLFFKGLTLCFE